MSKSKSVWFILSFLLGGGSASAEIAASLPNQNRVQLLASDRQVCVLRFETSDLEVKAASLEGVDQDIFALPGEGVTLEPGRPLLPAISRFVVVPAQCGLALRVEAQGTQTVQAEHPPLMVNDPQIGPVPGREYWAQSELYPPIVAELSEPVVIRGVRLVKLTIYPVQYNAQTQSYIHHTSVDAEIQFTDDPPVNPVEHPPLRGRSQQFYKFIESIAVNGDQVRRDDPDADEPRPYVGHYLLVMHQNCLQFAAPFIEWRRKAGYKVDILSLSAGDAGNVGTIQQRIRQVYNGFVQQGQDPFEYLLLIGDRRSHYYPPAAEWILESQTGQPTWGDPHADYLLACMDDRDSWPDCAVARWPSGSRDRMELAVGRTLAYEMTPRMQNPEWFTRGGVYSQHWGNGEQTAWHITIHTNVRWGEEVLKSLGFTNITFHERYQWDQMGAEVGPVIRDLLNNGTNLMIGRAENYYFVPGRGNRSFDQEIRDNNVFPMELNTSGHGEWSREIMFRTGSGAHLKGYAATTFAWNGPPTAPMSAVWMEMVNGMLQRDLPFGWAYVKGITAFQLYFPDFQWSGRSLYANVCTETNDFGDPAMQPWIGVPRLVTAETPDTLAPQTRLIAVRVLDQEGENPVAGAQVTFYAPGNMPAFDNANYATYNQMYSRTTTSDETGWARLMVAEDVDLAGNTAFVTVTGRDIRPLITPVPIRANRPVIELAEFTVDDPDGNQDSEVNPGETIQLSLTAQNLGRGDPAPEVQAVVVSLSPWVEVENSEVEFGDIEAGGAAEANRAVVLHISPACPDGSCRPSTKPLLAVDFRSGEQVWHSAVQLDPRAPHFSIVRVVGGNVIPANRHDLDIELLNEGRMDSPRLTARIANLGMGVGVVTETAAYPAIDIGESRQVTGGLFLVAGNRIAVPGSSHKMMMTLTTETGFVDSVSFSLQVEQARERAPLGPDPYGYICFDDTDQDWDIAPEFDWIEINPRAQNPTFEGTSCQFTGQSEQNIGESRVIELGFTTRFYGHEYDRITIGTNGFIALGAQPRITNFQNWPMERCQGGGVGMIAPLWDDLQVPNGAQVYYFYDEDQARFIVQWSRLRHRNGGNNDLNFEVVLFDAEVWCPNGEDTNILFQYLNVSNVQGQQEGQHIREKQTPFASVGISSPDGNSGLGYSWENTYPVAAAPLADRRALLFATSPRFRSGYLCGYVTDAANGNPIEGAIVFTEHGFTANTNAQGFWEINNALAEVPFDITALKQGYNDSTYTDTLLHENDTLQIDFALLHPEFTPSAMRLSTMMDPELERELPLHLDNTGNGPMTWSVERRLLGDANAEPWEFRRAYAVGDSMDDDNLFGVAFVDSIFWVTGRNDDSPTIYRFNMDGALIDTIPQPTDDNTGMKDITWDGENFWGTVGRQVLCFNRQGELQRQFEGSYNPLNNITWDPDREWLWVSGTTTATIDAYNREGQIQQRISRGNIRMYGHAYWTEDPDRMPLYIFHKERETDRQVIAKANIETGEIRQVTYLDRPETSPMGIFITNKFDVYSWVLMSVANVSRVGGGDRIDIWQLDARKDWFGLDLVSGEERSEAISGVINPGEGVDYILTLHSVGLPMVLFQGELRFTHNAVGGVTNILVQMDVIGPRPPFPFSLLEPANGDTLDSTIVNFSWQPTFDPNWGEEVTYNFWLATEVDSVMLVVGTEPNLTVDIDTLGLEFGWNSRFNWRVEAISGEDVVPSGETFEFLYLFNDLMGAPELTPVEFGFRSIHPNPFNAAATLEFGLDRPESVKLTAYDLTGREAAVVFDAAAEAGIHRLVWRPTELASGIYIIRLTAGSRIKMAKVIILK